MRRITTFLLAAGFTGILATGCNSDEKTYSDAEYILFADTMSTNMVFQDEAYFTIPIASTVACDYDRTIGVEVIDKGSTAIEGYHYRLRSNTITIKAGERTANVEVAGSYDHIQDTDSLGFILKLVMPEQLNWSNLYTDYDKTKVVLYKGCPYDPETFTGWCVVTSMFLYEYPGLTNTDQSYQRLIKTEVDMEENTIILHDWLFDGYDVKLKFDNSDPANPRVTMPEDQLLSDELSVFGQVNGDNRILRTSSPAYISYFNTCQSFVALWLRAYVYDLSTLVGYVGDFYNVLEWVSDEEADRLQREEGM